MSTRKTESRPLRLGPLAVEPGHKEVVIQTPTRRHSLTCKDKDDVNACVGWLRGYVETHEVTCSDDAIHAMLELCNTSIAL